LTEISKEEIQRIAALPDEQIANLPFWRREIIRICKEVVEEAREKNGQDKK